jgi:hypothetical protein
MDRNRTDRRTDPLPAGSLDPVAALAILRAEIESAEEKPVDGFRTTQGWADAWDVSREHATRLLNRGLDSGITEQRYFRVKRGLIVRKVRYFRVNAKVAA